MIYCYVNIKTQIKNCEFFVTFLIQWIAIFSLLHLNEVKINLTATIIQIYAAYSLHTHARYLCTIQTCINLDHKIVSLFKYL